MRRLLIVFCLMLVGAASGCTRATMSGVAAGVAGAANPSKLMIFGGPNHETYLGCLNCSQFATDSVSNAYGQKGSPYSTTSIWNPYSQFGSPYSTYSACNPYATAPPVIVDQDGNYYGRLSLNTYHPQFGAGRNYYDWLKASVCE